MVGGVDACRRAAESRTQTKLCCIEGHVKAVTERLEARAEETGRLDVDCGGVDHGVVGERDAVMRGLSAVTGNRLRTGGQPPSERLHLAAIRGIADELDRSLAQTSSQPTLSLRLQLAEELERLARELRQNDSTFDDEAWLRR